MDKKTEKQPGTPRRQNPQAPQRPPHDDKPFPRERERDEDQDE